MLKVRLKRSLCAIAFGIVLNLPAMAGPLIYEPFKYSLGGLSGNGPAKGFASAWSGGMTVATNDLSYGVLVNDGYSASFAGGDANISVGTTLFDAGLMSHGTTLWFAVVWRTRDAHTNCDASFALGSDNLSGANGIPMSTGNGGNGIGAYFRRGRNLAAATWQGGGKGAGADVAMAAFTNHLVVGEVTWGADSNAVDTITIYTPDETLGEKGAAISSRSVVLDQSTFNRVSFGIRSGSEYADEIRFGATYEDVALLPPPTGTVVTLY